MISEYHVIARYLVIGFICYLIYSLFIQYLVSVELSSILAPMRTGLTTDIAYRSLSNIEGSATGWKPGSERIANRSRSRLLD